MSHQQKLKNNEPNEKEYSLMLWGYWLKQTKNPKIRKDMKKQITRMRKMSVRQYIRYLSLPKKTGSFAKWSKNMEGIHSRILSMQ